MAKGTETGQGPVPARVCQSLLFMRETYAYATEFCLSEWEDPLGMETLRRWGLHVADIGQFLQDGLVEHGLEASRPGRKKRSVEPTFSRVLSSKSCFVLTQKGLILANECARAAGLAEMDVDKPKATRPQWNRQLKELRYLQNLLVKDFSRQPGSNQEALLSAFQTRGWCRCIANPFVDDGNVDPKSRFMEAVKDLNGHQVHRLIRFRRVGEECIWQPFLV
jgi:hypothetical protein